MTALKRHSRIQSNAPTTPSLSPTLSKFRVIYSNTQSYTLNTKSHAQYLDGTGGAADKLLEGVGGGLVVQAGHEGPEVYERADALLQVRVGVRALQQLSVGQACNMEAETLDDEVVRLPHAGPGILSV